MIKQANTALTHFTPLKFVLQVAKQREIRRRKRLEKEIRQMQKHSKKPKPVDELTLDVKSARNIE